MGYEYFLISMFVKILTANHWEILDYQEQRENPTNFQKKKTQRLQNQNGSGCVNL